MNDTLPADLRESPLFLTARAALALTQQARKALRVAGIKDVNPAQLSILAMLDGGDGVTPSQIARTLMYEKSTLTPLLDKLEASGLLLRARDPKDGRIQRLYLTRKGRRRRADADAVVRQVIDPMLDAVNKKVLRHHIEFCQQLLAAGGRETPNETEE